MVNYPRSNAARLKAAFALLTRKTWAQRTFAEDALGSCVKPTDVEACSFCAVGAIRANTPPHVTSHLERKVKRKSEELYGTNLFEVNDGYRIRGGEYDDTKVTPRTALARVRRVFRAVGKDLGVQL